MSTNYASQYAKALSQQYEYVLRFGALYARKQEGDYRWINSHTIEVPTIAVTGRVDASRSSMTSLGSWTQRHSNSWTPLALANHRKWNDFIHPLDITETNEALAITNLTRVMNAEEKFPEMDRYLVSKVYADWKGLGRVEKTGTIASNTILGYFDQMMVEMTEHNVPDIGRILYITPTANLALKAAINMYRTELAAPANIQRAIAYLDNVSVEEVPSGSMKTVYDFTVGSVPGVSAKQIEMFLVHPSAVITPENYEFAQIDPPSAGTEGKYLYFEESYNDVFILPNKQYGIEFFVNNMSNTSATFTSAASSAAGAVAGDCCITMTAPTGDNLKAGSRYFYAVDASTAPTAVTYGLVPGGDWTEWDGKSSTVLSITNGYKATVLVADKDGRVYAAGNGTITSKT